jgi:hypothetical protein
MSWEIPHIARAHAGYKSINWTSSSEKTYRTIAP